MKVDSLKLEGLRFTEGMQEMISDIKQSLEQRINLKEYSENVRPVVLNNSQVMRTCMLVGLSDATPRDCKVANGLNMSKSAEPLPSTFFTKAGLKEVFEALLKLR